MKTINKSLSLLLSAIMILSMFTGMNISTSALNIDDLSYEIIDGEVTITDFNESAGGEFVIPSTIEGYPVTELGFGAFSGCKSLTSVIIPDSVTKIGDHAFSGCESLTSITIPDGVTYIGNQAFGNCTSLTSVTLSNSVTYIGFAAFLKCTALASITIPDSVTYISEGAFLYCESLTSITIPAGVTFIAPSAFGGCNSITDVYYCGTKEEWDDINKDDGSEWITVAHIHYNAVMPDIPDNNKAPVFTDSRIIVKNGCVLVPPMSKTELDAVSSETYKINDSKGLPKTDGALVAGDTLICSGNSYKILVLFDADGNGKITSADARLILRCTLRLENISDDIRFAVTADETRKPTSSDARKALRVALRLDTI